MSDRRVLWNSQWSFQRGLQYLKALLARKEAREKAEAEAAAAAAAATAATEAKTGHTQKKEPVKGKGKRHHEDFDACMDLDAHSEEPSEEVLEEPSEVSKTVEGTQKEGHPRARMEPEKQQGLDPGRGKRRGKIEASTLPPVGQVCWE